MDVSKNLTDVYSKIDLRHKNLGNIMFVHTEMVALPTSPPLLNPPPLGGKWSKVELE